MRAFPGSFQNFSGISCGKSQLYWWCGPEKIVSNNNRAHAPGVEGLYSPRGHSRKPSGKPLPRTHVCVFCLKTRTAIYRSLRALRARNPQKGSKRSPRASRPGVSKKFQKSLEKSGSSARGRCRRGRSEIPHFCSKLQSFPLSSRRKRRKAKKNKEKRRKTKKNEKNEKAKKNEKKRKKGKIPPTPSTPTPLRTSQKKVSQKSRKVWEKSFLFRLLNSFRVRTRRIGVNPGKSDLVNFRGPD